MDGRTAAKTYLKTREEKNENPFFKTRCLEAADA